MTTPVGPRVHPSAPPRPENSHHHYTPRLQQVTTSLALHAEVSDFCLISIKRPIHTSLRSAPGSCRLSVLCFPAALTLLVLSARHRQGCGTWLPCYQHTRASPSVVRSHYMTAHIAPPQPRTGPWQSIPTVRHGKQALGVRRETRVWPQTRCMCDTHKVRRKQARTQNATTLAKAHLN